MGFGVFIVSFRIFGLASLVAVSLSISGAAHANLFKDLKKALGDVEKQLAPQGGGNGNSASSGGSTQSSGGASSPVAASQPDDFGDSESSIRFICEPVPTSSIYKKLSQPDFKTVESDFGMPKDQLDIAFKKSKPVSHPYLINFDIYKTGFATDEVEELFANFARRPNAKDLAVMVATGAILSLTVFAEGWMNEKITMVFSRITAIILAGLSVQYVIDGLAAIGLVTP